MFRAFECEMAAPVADPFPTVGGTRQATRRDETCYFLDGAIRNMFWTGTDGTVWRSRQWIGPGLGYAEIERLK